MEKSECSPLLTTSLRLDLYDDLPAFNEQTYGDLQFWLNISEIKRGSDFSSMQVDIPLLNP